MLNQMKGEGKGEKTSEIIDVPLIGIVALMALMASMWQSGFFSNIC